MLLYQRVEANKTKQQRNGRKQKGMKQLTRQILFQRLFQQTEALS